MDLETSTDAVDGVFETLGIEGVYTSPASQTSDCTAMSWSPKEQRRSAGASFGGVEVAVRSLFILVRKAEVAEPVSGGLFVLGVAGAAGSFRIGEDTPIAHDTHGLVWRCGVTRED